MPKLPKPVLDARLLGAHRLPALTDDALFEACGVRIAFTSRAGGVSEGPYASLNLGKHVQDDPRAVGENRARVLEALGAPEAPLVVPNQVHGTNVVALDSIAPDRLAALQSEADEGADALVACVRGVAVLLNFADCTPVIVVSPTGRFAVAHAGWRGALAGVAGKAARALAQADERAGAKAGPQDYNAYIGPHIRARCYETSAEIAQRFADAYGAGCVPETRHVSMAAAVRCDLNRAGVDADRVADARVCTSCSADDYFSYRASGGLCGRHGAVAIAKEQW